MSIDDDFYACEAALSGTPHEDSFERLMEHLKSCEQDLEVANTLLNKTKIFKETLQKFMED